MRMAHRLHVLAAMLVLVVAVDARANVYICGQDDLVNQCICIAWSNNSFEMRCPASGSDRLPYPGTTLPSPPPGEGGGTWGGNGTPKNAVSPAPGTAIASGELLLELTRAKDEAKVALRREPFSPDGEPDPKGRTFPSKCADLFLETPLGLEGYELLGNGYVVFRGGEGLQDQNGVVQCASGVPAWTTCCDHSKYVFICNSFKMLSARQQTNVIIHEVLHVAGQREGSGYPASSPSPEQIRDRITSACGY